MELGKREMMVRFTVFSDKDHPPIAIQCLISDELAVELMGEKITNVSVAVFDSRGMLQDKSDQKPMV